MKNQRRRGTVSWPHYLPEQLSRSDARVGVRISPIHLGAYALFGSTKTFSKLPSIAISYSPSGVARDYFSATVLWSILWVRDPMAGSWFLLLDDLREIQNYFRAWVSPILLWKMQSLSWSKPMRRMCAQIRHLCLICVIEWNSAFCISLCFASQPIIGRVTKAQFCTRWVRHVTVLFSEVQTVLPWSLLRPSSISCLAYHLIFCYWRDGRGKGIMNGSSEYVTEGHGPNQKPIPWGESWTKSPSLSDPKNDLRVEYGLPFIPPFGMVLPRETLLLWR